MKNFAPLIISGASGSGKSTLITDLLLKYSNLFNLTISQTTRSIREGEIPNFHYYYINETEFVNMVSTDKFLEHEKVHTNYYGTSKAEIERIKNLKKIAILDIDIKGAINIYKNNRLGDSNFMFITVPNLETLRQRLINRKTETLEKIEIRIKNAEKEIEKANNSKIYAFENIIVNDDLETTKAQFLQRIKQLYSLDSMKI